MADLAKLVVSLEAQTTRYMTELDRANKRLDRFGKQQEKSIDAISAGFKRLGGVVAGISFASLIKGTIDANNHLGDMSARLGISTEALSRLQYAAEVTGVSAATLEMGLQRMTRRIAEAAVGSGEAQAALRELGISAQSIATLAPEQQFRVLADALNNVSEQGDKVRLAMKLFDSEGVALLQTLNGGTAALDAYATEADRLGRTISTEAAQAAEQFNKNLIQTKSLLNSLVQEILNRALPAINQFGNLVRMALRPEEGDELRKQLLATDGAIYKIEKRLQRWAGTENLTEGMTRQLAEDNAELERLYHVRDVLLGKVSEMAPQIPPSQNIAIPEPPKGATKRYQDTFEIEAQKAAAAWQREQEMAATKLDTVRFGLLTEEEALLESYARRDAIIEDALRRRLISEQAANDMLVRNARKREEELTAVEEEEQRARLGAMSETFSNIAILTESAQGRASGIHKAAAITQATIDGYRAVQAALAGPPGPPWSFAVAASVAAMTTANVAKIAGTRAMGGPVVGGNSYLVGERGPEVVTFPANGVVTPNHKLSPNINVNIIEDNSRAGQVNQSGNDIEVFVALATQRVRSEIQSGVGIGAMVQRRGIR